LQQSLKSAIRAFSYPGTIGLHLFAHQAVDLNGRSRSELIVPLLRIVSAMRVLTVVT